MKTINIKKQILTLKGDPLKKGDSVWEYGEYLAELVLSLKVEGAMKKLEIAKKLIEDVEEVSFENSSFAIIKQAVEQGKYFNDEHNGLNTLFNGQILEYLEEIKDVKPEIISK